MPVRHPCGAMPKVDARYPPVHGLAPWLRVAKGEEAFWHVGLAGLRHPVQADWPWTLDAAARGSRQGKSQGPAGLAQLPLPFAVQS